MTTQTNTNETFGTVDYNGIKVTLTQQAHLTHNTNHPNNDSNHYAASGQDATGNDYSVTWEIINPDADEEDACDWDDYSVELLGS